jgi:hypothetical protein
LLNLLGGEAEYRKASFAVCRLLIYGELNTAADDVCLTHDETLREVLKRFGNANEASISIAWVHVRMDTKRGCKVSVA